MLRGEEVYVKYGEVHKARAAISVIAGDCSSTKVNEKEYVIEPSGGFSLHHRSPLVIAMGKLASRLCSYCATSPESLNIPTCCFSQKNNIFG